jgi:acyl-CoA reductase-like NAD-dependent aldehyde dehydrogenase
MSEPTLGTDHSGLVSAQLAPQGWKTRPVERRIEQLQAIKKLLEERRDAMGGALWHDLRPNKPDARPNGPHDGRRGGSR